MATVFYGGAFTGKVSTSSGSLNVRDTASTSAPIVNTLPRNSLKTFGSNYMTDYGTYAREWLLHYQNGPNTTPEGYVSSKYITWLPSYGDGACFRTNVVVTPGQYVNLRQSPSTSSTSIHRLHNGDAVLVLYLPNFPVSNWTHIATAGGTGWIMTSFLALLG